MRVGFELEVASQAGAVLGHLREMGLTQHDGLHAYHCDCGQCNPNSSWLFKAQEDCTANGEFISSILEYGSPRFESAITGLSVALMKSGASTTGGVGNHVHVDGDAMYQDKNAQLRLLRLFGRYETDLMEIASGRDERMRRYNGESLALMDEAWNLTEWESRDTSRSDSSWYPRSDPRFMFGGNLLAFKSQTIEFRLWNSTRQAWRIRTHVGLSVAMMEAALNGEDATRDDGRILEDVIGDYIDGPTWAGILRQRFSKGGFAAEVAA